MYIPEDKIHKSIDEFQAILLSVDVIASSADRMDPSVFGKEREGFADLKDQIEKLSRQCHAYAKKFPELKLESRELLA
jgi:hypothetical protein